MSKQNTEPHELGQKMTKKHYFCIYSVKSHLQLPNRLSSLIPQQQNFIGQDGVEIGGVTSTNNWGQLLTD